ncbi:DEDD exonuclease domain-containing protein [Salinactinospora qingdaonensis]|uniref:DEDD exonuclease domain-containing protein n=1 Tax=Salinactinospora qingdaonensis TaxID=702744 RepID=A0ABP7FI08_9ACTN
MVVDLETTGSRGDGAGITEIGAVKVRGGEILGEFATLVDPGVAIPPFITLLTGITQTMVAEAPAVAEVLPSFLEFAGFDRGTVLVAHNAPFDTGFLKDACVKHGYPWPAPAVVDTVALARRLVTRDEVANHKLATLAGFFGGATQPTHRALDDARATVEVLHGLLERIAAFGVTTSEELCRFRSAPTTAQRRNRHLAEGLPQTPGVYIFEDASGAALYVGKSDNLRKRVKSYFTAAETRARVREMIALAARVTPITCATGLEAEVRELRLIAERKPAYNRRSRHPERAVWLKLTRETYPRLSIVRETREDAAAYIGPFPSTRRAEMAREALHHTFQLRQCSHRLGPKSTPVAACALAQMGRCGAPCEGGESPEEYAVHAQAAHRAMTVDAAPVVTALTSHIRGLSAQLRFEEAAVHRDRLTAFVEACARAERLTTLARLPHLVAARRAAAGWEMCVVRHGRLAASGVLTADSDPQRYLEALVATAETVAVASPEAGPVPRATAAEMECVLRWLETPGVRLVELEGSWTCPVGGAQKYRSLTDWTHGRPSLE